MDYPYSLFVDHLKRWENYHSRPGEPVPSVETVRTRMFAMMLGDDIDAEKLNYRVDRFYQILRFLGLRHSAFSDGGIFIAADGREAATDARVFMAIHETFRGSPLLNSDTVDPAPVVALALSYAEVVMRD